MAYCDTSDLYSYGLTRGALVTPARQVESVDVSTNALELDAHGFADGDAVQFRSLGGGSLPSPLAAATTYYVVAVDSWRFSVASVSGGSAIDITDAGTTFAVVHTLPEEAIREKASRLIDDMCPAHVVPFESPYPDIVRMTCAELAAAELLAITGGKTEALGEVYDRARKRIERWARNVPIRGTNAPPTAQRSTVRSSVGASLNPWRRYGGIA